MFARSNAYARTFLLGLKLLRGQPQSRVVILTDNTTVLSKTVFRRTSTLLDGMIIPKSRETFRNERAMSTFLKGNPAIISLAESLRGSKLNLRSAPVLGGLEVERIIIFTPKRRVKNSMGVGFSSSRRVYELPPNPGEFVELVRQRMSESPQNPIPCLKIAPTSH